MRSIRGKPYDISRKHMTIVDNRGGRSPELRRREKDRPPFFEKQRGDLLRESENIREFVTPNSPVGRGETSHEKDLYALGDQS
jgi:hypothetical protein